MKQNTKLETFQAYRPIFVDRKTGTQQEADYLVHLYPSEVIEKQIELSSIKTVVLFKGAN